MVNSKSRLDVTRVRLCVCRLFVGQSGSKVAASNNRMITVAAELYRSAAFHLAFLPFTQQVILSHAREQKTSLVQWDDSMTTDIVMAVRSPARSQWQVTSDAGGALVTARWLQPQNRSPKGT